MPIIAYDYSGMTIGEIHCDINNHFTMYKNQHPTYEVHKFTIYETSCFETFHKRFESTQHLLNYLNTYDLQHLITKSVNTVYVHLIEMITRKIEGEENGYFKEIVI